MAHERGRVPRGRPQTAVCRGVTGAAPGGSARVHGVSVLLLLVVDLLEVASHEREVNATSSRPTTGHLRGWTPAPRGSRRCPDRSQTRTPHRFAPLRRCRRGAAVSTVYVCITYSSSTSTSTRDHHHEVTVIPIDRLLTTTVVVVVVPSSLHRPPSSCRRRRHARTHARTQAVAVAAAAARAPREDAKVRSGGAGRADATTVTTVMRGGSPDDERTESRAGPSDPRGAAGRAPARALGALVVWLTARTFPAARRARTAES